MRSFVVMNRKGLRRVWDVKCKVKYKSGSFWENYIQTSHNRESLSHAPIWPRSEPCSAIRPPTPVKRDTDAPFPSQLQYWGRDHSRTMLLVVFEGAKGMRRQGWGGRVRLQCGWRILRTRRILYQQGEMEALEFGVDSSDDEEYGEERDEPVTVFDRLSGALNESCDLFFSFSFTLA